MISKISRKLTFITFIFVRSNEASRNRIYRSIRDVCQVMRRVVVYQWRRREGEAGWEAQGPQSPGNCDERPRRAPYHQTAREDHRIATSRGQRAAGRRRRTRVFFKIVVLPNSLSCCWHRSETCSDKSERMVSGGTACRWDRNLQFGAETATIIIASTGNQHLVKYRFPPLSHWCKFVWGQKVINNFAELYMVIWIGNDGV